MRTTTIRSGCAAPRIALLLALAAVAGTAHAGILRDVFAKVGIGGSSKPQVGANGEVPVFPRQGFLCCNQHYDGDWVDDGNFASIPDLLKAGTPVTVLGYGKNRANIDVNGMPMRLGHDYGRDQESLDAWVNKIVVKDDPRPRISSAPANVQAAIRAGKLTLGMTRQQVLLAVGYPPTHLTKNIDSDVWKLLVAKRSEYQVHFGADGRVSSVTGDGEVTSQVIYLPSRK
jgi:hypothetical protein